MFKSITEFFIWLPAGGTQDLSADGLVFLKGNTLDFGTSQHFNVPVSLSGADIPGIDASAPGSQWSLQLWASNDDKLSSDDVPLDYHVSPTVGAQVARGLLAGNSGVVQEYVQGRPYYSTKISCGDIPV